MPDRTRQTGRSTATVPLVVAVVAALITAVMVVAPRVSNTSDSDTRPETASDVSRDTRTQPRESLESPDPLAALVRRQPDDPMALGEVDAPVVMIAYSEFQCPFCAKFARDTEPILIEKYVEDGTLRIEWRDFPYLGPESTTAAEAGRAAAAQGEFWAFHDAMYADQQPPNSGRLTEDYLAGIAEKIGLDVEQFRNTMNTPETADAVKRDFDEGQLIGVTGTPAFLVNGQPIMGAQPTEVFEAAIEQAAAGAR